MRLCQATVNTGCFTQAEFVSQVRKPVSVFQYPVLLIHEPSVGEIGQRLWPGAIGSAQQHSHARRSVPDLFCGVHMVAATSRRGQLGRGAVVGNGFHVLCCWAHYRHERFSVHVSHNHVPTRGCAYELITNDSESRRARYCGGGGRQFVALFPEQ